MNFSLKTTKMLWGRAAGMCSMPGCRKQLFIDATETDDETLIGEMCHIVADSGDGPRGKSELTQEQRDKYGNLILLCRNHHREVDQQENKYTVDVLLEMKSSHEAWIRSRLSTLDIERQRNDEIVSGYIDEWAKLSHLDEWENWNSHVFGGGQPHLRTDVHDDLAKLRNWMLTRIWPSGYESLSGAFENFRRVLSDFLEVFGEHAVARGPDQLETEKFYKLQWHEEEVYQRLFHQFDHHVDLVQDLMLEMTRAGNFLCEEVRRSLIPNFNLESGYLTIMSGPHMDFTFRRQVILYSEGEKSEKIPYPGLDKFLTVRVDRDLHFGSGPE